MIRKISTLVTGLLCTLMAAGQSLPNTKTVNGIEATIWRAPARLLVQDLPKSVDNSTSVHFPPIFNQMGSSCAQASTIGYIFTYEMNALLDRDASVPENRFSYLYTWNLVNDGVDTGSYQFQGLQISTSHGVMTEADFPKQTSAFNHKWASGFDKYLRAIKYKGDRFVTLEIKDSSSLYKVKQYLYNKGEEGQKGGLLSFSSLATGWKFNKNYSGPSETGYKAMLTQLAYDGPHAMTIVGYDDLIEFERPDGKISKGAFIAVNTYGDDYWYHDNGRFYLPYWFFISEHSSSELSNDLMGIIPKYQPQPQIVFKVALDYTSRNDLCFRYGFSDNCADTAPMHNYKFPIFECQGGDLPMQGRGASAFIEFAMDFSTYANRLDGVETPNWFLTVERAERGKELGEGVMRAFEVYDYRQDPNNPIVYKHTDINGVKIEKGTNIFNIPSVEPPATSFSPLEWLNKSKQPIASPYVFRTADGKYAKVRFSEYDRESGTIKIKYVYAPSGSTNLE